MTGMNMRNATFLKRRSWPRERARPSRLVRRRRLRSCTCSLFAGPLWKSSLFTIPQEKLGGLAYLTIPES